MNNLYVPTGGALRFAHVVDTPLQYRLSEIERIKLFMLDIDKLCRKSITIHDFMLKNDAVYKAMHDNENPFIDDLGYLEREALSVEDFVKKYGSESLPLINKTFNDEKITKIDFKGCPFELSFFMDINQIEGTPQHYINWKTGEPVPKMSIIGFAEKYKNGRPIKISDHDREKLDSYKAMVRDNGYLGATNEVEPKAIIAEYDTYFMELQAMEYITNDLLRLERVKEHIATIDEPTERAQYVINETNAEGWDKSNSISDFLTTELRKIYTECFHDSEPISEPERLKAATIKDRTMFLLEMGLVKFLKDRGVTDQKKQCDVLSWLLGGNISTGERNIKNWKDAEEAKDKKYRDKTDKYLKTKKSK
jgi:hypothetical protein